jgi:predicted dehydrogenase
MRARVAILGAGYISDFHIRALKAVPDLSLAAVCDNDARKADAVAARWMVPRAYHSLDRMLESGEIDVVHVLVPPPHHGSAAVACLKAGCDVFIEKPLAPELSECLQIKLAAGHYQRLAGVNHNAIYHPAFRRLVRGIQEGRLGGVQHVTAFGNLPLRQLNAGQHGHWMFAKPVNIILEQAPHPLSQIQFLVGNMEAISSQPSGPVRLNSGSLFYDTWQVSAVCERGSAHCFLSFGREFFDSWLHVVGEDGSAYVDLRRNTVLFLEKTRFMEPVEQLLLSGRSAIQQVAQAVRNFLDYSLGFLKLKPAADPFYRSMHRSIAAFHEARALRQPPPVTLEQASALIEACHLIAQPAAESETEANSCETVTS